MSATVWHARDRGQVPVVIGLAAGVLPLVGVRPAFEVEDDDGIVVAAVIGRDERVPVELYAQRLAELLNRHGLTDTPDTTADIPEEP